MEQQTLRKTFKYKLKPTPHQERTLAFILRRCRELYNAGLQERRDAWQQGGVSITAASQSAHLPAIKQDRPEYREIHSQVLQDVRTRLDRAFHACFRRVQQGETPGYPRFQGEQRYTSFTDQQFGNGATLDNGFLVLSKLGRVAMRWSRPLAGTPKTVTLSQAPDGWYACCSCIDAPVQPLPQTGQESGIDLGLEAFATLADGTRVENPRPYRTAERAVKKAQRRVCWPSSISGCDGSAATFISRPHWRCCASRTLCITKTCRRPTCSRTTSSPSPSRTPGGACF
jgi:putative transposase